MELFIDSGALTVICDSIERTQSNNLRLLSKGNTVGFIELDKFKLKFKRTSEKYKFYQVVGR